MSIRHGGKGYTIDGSMKENRNDSCEFEPTLYYHRKWFNTLDVVIIYSIVNNLFIYLSLKNIIIKGYKFDLEKLTKKRNFLILNIGICLKKKQRFGMWRILIFFL